MFNCTILWSMCQSCQKKFLCLFEKCARNTLKGNMLPTDQLILSWIQIFKTAFWVLNVFNFYRNSIDIELLKTRVLPRIRTEHMPHPPRYRMTNGLKREFAVLYYWTMGSGNVVFLHFHCEKCYFVRAKVLYI